MREKKSRNTVRKAIQSFCLCLGWLFSGALIAQEAAQVRFAGEINEDNARKHLSVLTSDELAGRGTGAIGARRTADYIRDEFVNMGLIAPVGGSYFQPVPLVEVGFQMEHFQIGGMELRQREGVYVQSDRSMQRFSAKEILFIAYNPDSERHLRSLDNARLAGKTVLLLGGDTESDPRRLQQVVARNPALVLFVSDEMIQRQSRGSRRGGARVLLANEYRPALRGETTSVAYLGSTHVSAFLSNAGHSLESLRQQSSRRKRSATLTPLSITLDAEFGMRAREFSDDNVLGLLPGSDRKEELLVLMAHYDHDGIRADGAILRGADDNGSGTVGLLEIARAWSEAIKNGHQPRRSVLFIALCAEEKGLLGSKYYVANPVFPLTNTVAALNMDMIGRIDDKHLDGNHDYVHIIGANKLSAELHDLVVHANERFTKMELDTTYNDPEDRQRLYYRSDHYNFAKQDIPSIFFFSGLHPDYHTPEDTIDKIDFGLLVKRAKLVFHTAWELANREKRIVLDAQGTR